MNISSVVVHSHPEHLSAVVQRLNEVSGVEVQGINPDGRLAVTLESPSTGGAADTYAGLHQLEGVLSVSLIYQYSDDDIDPEEAE